MPASYYLVRLLTLCHCFLLCVDYFAGYSAAATQAIEAYRDARRQAGAEVAPGASRSLEEQLLVLQARLQLSHRMLRRLQRAGAQVLAALWLGEVIPRTPSQTAD